MLEGGGKMIRMAALITIVIVTLLGISEMVTNYAPRQLNHKSSR